MLKKSFFLLAIVLAIQYVRADEVAPQTEAAVAPAVVPTETIQPLTAAQPTAVDLAAGSTASLLTPPDIGLSARGSPKKKKTYFPVDLIGKKKGCISIEHIHKCGNVHKWNEPNNKMTIQACWRQCLGQKSSYAALARGNECMCSNSTITKDAPKGTADIPCSGSFYQKCGSQNCADFYVLKINSDSLRHSVRNLEDKNTWVYKNGFGKWVRTVDNKFDFELNEIFPASSAIYAFRDCAKTPRPNCQPFKVVLNGYEDAIITPNEVTPIDVEWDFVFAKEKKNHADKDVLLFRRSLCEWVLKENEVITREFSFDSFDDKTRTLTLVDLKDSTRTVKVNDFYYKEYESNTEKESFVGKWFNKIHHFKDYFRGTDVCTAKTA